MSPRGLLHHLLHLHNYDADQVKGSVVHGTETGTEVVFVDVVVGETVSRRRGGGDCPMHSHSHSHSHSHWRLPQPAASTHETTSLRTRRTVRKGQETEEYHWGTTHPEIKPAQKKE